MYNLEFFSCHHGISDWQAVLKNYYFFLKTRNLKIYNDNLWLIFFLIWKFIYFLATVQQKCFIFFPGFWLMTQLFNKATNKLTEQLPKSKIIADTAVTNKLIIKDKKHRHKKVINRHFKRLLSIANGNLFVKLTAINIFFH